MLVNTQRLLEKARQGGYALGAFNVYNLEGAIAVVEAAQELNSPVIIQMLPSALSLGGTPLIRLCLEAGQTASVPVAVHLDHCASPERIAAALDAGVMSVMADGSMLDFSGNIDFTKKTVQMAYAYAAGVEGELGRLGGSEDGELSLEAAGAKMTQPHQAVEFVERTRVSALAVCIGNVHGKYETAPRLDFERLEAIQSSVSIPLVLHGTSGLPDEMIVRAIRHGVCKFNVNTEIRSAALERLNQLFKAGTPELVDVMHATVAAMKQPVKEKIRLFGSTDKALQ